MNTVAAQTKRSDSERGGALVEFAIVAPLLVLILLGLVEVGFGWLDSQRVIQGSRSGARVAAQMGTDPLADQRAVEAIEAGLESLRDGVEKIVIFDASETDTPTEDCLTTAHPGVPGICSVYYSSHFEIFTSGSWLPTTRKNDLDNADLIGVYIELKRPLTTGIFGSGEMTMRETTIMRVEPDLGG